MYKIGFREIGSGHVTYTHSTTKPYRAIYYAIRLAMAVGEDTIVVCAGVFNKETVPLYEVAWHEASSSISISAIHVSGSGRVTLSVY